ncbi:hypothetical protein R1flu_026207 [Riccia fluitans]|uniref:Protein kinase domain-containing protein n=1 Tax=Riccia fluitans TaxID=41844 RepID=A0ABD1XFW1_9MARC
MIWTKTKQRSWHHTELPLTAGVEKKQLQSLKKELKEAKGFFCVQAIVEEDVRAPLYKYEDLRLATEGFFVSHEVGRGRHGVVYKAHLPDGTIVAVKQLKEAVGWKRSNFLKEVVLLTEFKHRNLISLKGCCVRGRERLLVYEYARNGDLAQVLWGTRSKNKLLTWRQRLKIIVGIAKGLLYLHEEKNASFYHGHIKAQNIFLDKDWNPKIADIGFRGWSVNVYRGHETHDYRAYISPEFSKDPWRTMRTIEQDVYSYGALLLEIVSGREWVHRTVLYGEVFLRDWAVELYKEGCLSRLIILLSVIPFLRKKVESAVQDNSGPN